MDESNDPHPRRSILTPKDFVRVNLGKLYWGCDIGGIQDVDTREIVSGYARKIVAHIDTGSGLIISGECGVGKTGAAAVLIKEAIRRGFATYFVGHSELRSLQFDDEVFGDGTDGISVNRRIMGADFVVLDGLDESFLTDKVFGPPHLERLVIRRNNNRLTTILTTRIPKEIKKQIGLFDVLRQTMLPIKIEGRNLRDEKEQELRTRILGDEN